MIFKIDFPMILPSFVRDNLFKCQNVLKWRINLRLSACRRGYYIKTYDLKYCRERKCTYNNIIYRLSHFHPLFKKKKKKPRRLSNLHYILYNTRTFITFARIRIRLAVVLRPSIRPRWLLRVFRCSVVCAELNPRWHFFREVYVTAGYTVRFGAECAVAQNIVKATTPCKSR